jgi:hypothetical protein
LITSIIINSLFCLDSLFLCDAFNYPHSHSLFHVSHCKSSQWRVFLKGLQDHWFLRNHSYKGSIPSLNEFRKFLSDGPGPSLDLAYYFLKLTSDVSCVAVEDWAVPIADLSWVVNNDNLGQELQSCLCWVVLSIGSNVASFNVFN